MAGILFIICIPTVEEENVILSKVQSDLAARSPIKTPTTTKDLRYGTFEVSNWPLLDCTNVCHPFTWFQKRGAPEKAFSIDETIRNRVLSKSESVSPGYNQRDLEASLTKAKSITSRDEGDGLRKGLLGSSTKSLIAASSSSEAKSRSTEDADLDLPGDAPMVDVVKAIITLTRVENAVWTEGNSHKKWQVCSILNLFPSRSLSASVISMLSDMLILLFLRSTHRLYFPLKPAHVLITLFAF